MDRGVFVLDGGMATSLQEAALRADDSRGSADDFRGSVEDFRGLDGCYEWLVETRPEIVRRVHDRFLAVGCDAVETNTFGAFAVALERYGIADRARDLNRRAAEIAREAVAAVEEREPQGSPRYVIGAVGPGSKLPSLGQIQTQELTDAYLPQMIGLLEGGVDAILIETGLDLLQVQAAVAAAREASTARGVGVPIMVSLTVDAKGKVLLGQEVEAAATALRPLGIDALGFNCSYGSSEMLRPVEALTRVGPARLIAMPNAGLPRKVDGAFVYPETPEAFGARVASFALDAGVGIVGGCCGATPAHLAALVARLRGV
jgi:5-methyltetrahydrofolate--homocysteine methyltransferase